MSVTPDPLFFLTILIRTMCRSSSAASLAKAVEEIETLGRQAGWEVGHRQWRQFLSLVLDAADVGEYPFPAVVLSRDGHEALRVRFSDQVVVAIAEPAGPGSYVLTLDNGRVLWRDALSGAHLLWRAAPPDVGIPLAAATPDTEPAPASYVAVVLDGAVTVHVHRGHEHGRIELHLRPIDGGIADER